MQDCNHKKRHFIGTTEALGEYEDLYSCRKCGMIVSETRNIMNQLENNSPEKEFIFG